MKNLKIMLLALLAGPIAAMASGGGNLQHANIDIMDQDSLQRGSKIFMNYCLSCHSAKYMRFQRLQEDLGLTEAEVIENLMFVTDKIGSTMDIAMTEKQATAYFGKPPPDLSVIGRSRTPDWLYTYFKTFYLDDSSATGWNNTLFADVGMPHVLADLQGGQTMKHEMHTDAHGEEVEVMVLEAAVVAGSHNEEEYDQAVNDLVNYLVYMGEPAKLQRLHYGPYVIMFLVFFSFLAYLLKKEYWKDVH